MLALVRIGFWLYRLTMSRFMLPLLFDLENARVDSFIARDHSVNGKTIPDTFAANGSIDFRKPFEGPHRLIDGVHQKTSRAVFNHLAAGAQVHGDHRHAGGIGFREHQSE